MPSNEEGARKVATLIVTNIISQLQNNSDLTDEQRQVIMSRLLAAAAAKRVPTSDECGAASGIPNAELLAAEIPDAELLAAEIPDAEFAAFEIPADEPLALDEKHVEQINKILTALSEFVIADKPVALRRSKRIRK